MKISKRIISTALATLMVGSTVAAGAISASAATVKKPTKVTAKNEQKTIKVSWKKVAGATSYKVYAGKKLIKTTKKTSYKYHAVYAGKKYTFTVKAVKGKNTSKASAAVKVVRMNYPVIRTVKNQPKSVKITWTKRKGATSYVLYKKAEGGTYKKITQTKKTSFKDTNVVSGTLYSYKVASYNKSTKALSVKSGKRSTLFLTKPKSVKAREAAGYSAADVSWNAVKNAESYDVYRRRAGETSFTKVANVTETNYHDSYTGINPSAYMYKIVAVKGSYQSADSDIVVAPYVPKTEGRNRYRLDVNNDAHVEVYLNVGEVYAEGKGLAEFFNLKDLYDVEVIEGSDVITVKDSVITGVKAGKAVIKLTATQMVQDFVAKNNRNGNRYKAINAEHMEKIEKYLWANEIRDLRKFNNLTLMSYVNNAIYVEVEVR